MFRRSVGSFVANYCYVAREEERKPNKTKVLVNAIPVPS